MATVPIVTEVTKVQLAALVADSGLNEGLQYKIIDSDWLLIATSNNSLVAINNTISLEFDEALPNYITCKKIIVDTGIMSSATTIVQLNAVVNYTGFVFKKISISVSGVGAPFEDPSMTVNSIAPGDLPPFIEIMPDSSPYIINNPIVHYTLGSMSGFYISAVLNANTVLFRLIIVYEKYEY
jgi:hypothetical protein